MKKTICMICGGMLLAVPVWAEDMSLKKVPTPTEGINPVTVDPFDTEIMKSPLIAKAMYRDMWEADNQPEYATKARLNKALADPTIPPELKKQLEKSKYITDSVDYSLKGKGVPSGADFTNPTATVEKAVSKTQMTATAEELKALPVVSKEEKEKLFKERENVKVRPNYPNIKISDF